MSIPIVPAVIPESRQALTEHLTTLGFVSEIHLDVVDGQFVPFASWPIAPSGEPKEVQAYTDRFTLEVDLMMKEPLPLARSFVVAGADMIVFHIETVGVAELVQFAEETKVSIGVCANNDTPHAQLSPYLAFADYVQVMGIAHIGSQGQPFDTRTLDRIMWIKSRQPDIFISVDGSVNHETIPALVKAGADRLICGSAIVKDPHPQEAHATLQAHANNSQPYL